MPMNLFDELMRELKDNPEIVIVGTRDYALPHPNNARLIKVILIAPKGAGLYDPDELQALQDSLVPEGMKPYFLDRFKMAHGLLELGQVCFKKDVPDSPNGEDDMQMVSVKLFPNAAIAASFLKGKNPPALDMRELKRHQDATTRKVQWDGDLVRL